jgi:hypothetical protein
MPTLVKQGLRKQLFTLLALWLSACGKSEEALEYPTPSYASVDVWLSGPPSKADWTGAKILSYTIEVSGCSDSSNNQTKVFTPTTEPQIMNLSEGSQGCLAALTSVQYGASALSDTFQPESGTPFSGAAGLVANFIGTATKEVLVVTIEAALASPLQHNEAAQFSVMPAKGENRLPAFVTATSFQGSSPLPNVLISQVVDEGAAGSDAHALLVMVECLDARVNAMCGTQNLLDMRFWSGIGVATTPTQSDVDTLAAKASALIIPSEVELWRNGFRFNLMVPKNPNGSYAAQMAVMARLGDSYRYMILDIEKMLPSLF